MLYFEILIVLHLVASTQFYVMYKNTCRHSWKFWISNSKYWGYCV